MNCSFSALVGGNDRPHAGLILPHQLRFVQEFCTDRFLVIDDLRDTPATHALKDFARENLENGGFTEVVSLSKVSTQRNQNLKDHFGKRPRWQRDFRGVPLLGWYAGLVSSDAEFHFHADSDILFATDSSRKWFESTSDLLRQHAEICCAAPLPGPPLDDCKLHQSDYEDRGELGLWFRSFSSRRFLIRRESFNQLLPLNLRSASRRILLKSLVSGKSPYLNWELLVDEKMRSMNRFRVNTRTPLTWTLHCDARGPEFEAKLPGIIEQVERGVFPEKQGGHYDLELDCW